MYTLVCHETHSVRGREGSLKDYLSKNGDEVPTDIDVGYHRSASRPNLSPLE